jgi:hypothetical protein
MSRSPRARTAWLAAFLVMGSLSTAAPAEDKPRESWDAVYMKGTKIGHVHTTVDDVKDPKNPERPLLRVRVDMELTFKRQNDRIRQRVRYGTIETPQGSVLRLDTRILTGTEELRTYGDVINGKMTLILEGAGQRQQEVITWGPEVRGPYAAEMSLARNPIRPGETRQEQMFIPGLNKIGGLKLIAQEFEQVELGGRVKRNLLRVEAPVTGPDGKPLAEASNTLWVDEGGQVLKSHSDVFGGMTFYRTTESAAKAPDGEVDLIAEQIVKIPQKIPNPERTRSILYQVALKDNDPAAIFPTDRRQTLRPSSTPGTMVLHVRTSGRDEGEAGPDRVDDAYLEPNPQINSNDPRIVALAKQAVGGQTDPWAKATAIQQWVARNIRAKNFSRGFAPASEVARNLTGDCTEHSVLTAAMCRAAGVPARVVIGLVYADHLNGFGYHMWNEVYVNRRWVAIDAAFNQSDVDAVHIKLSDSSLDGVSPFESFLAVAQVFNKLSLRPLEIR